jgi:hypothetical protein
MALTDEQNEEIIRIRNQLTSALTALNNLAREVGANPVPLEDVPPAPATTLILLPPETATASANVVVAAPPSMDDLAGNSP